MKLKHGRRKFAEILLVPMSNVMWNYYLKMIKKLWQNMNVT